jgi:DNA-binding response OmpR family regulator
MIRKLVGEFLSRDGHEVLFANDGIDAMVLLKKFLPDLLVLDIMMPEVNGYDVCHNIKLDPDLKDLPIVIMTSRDQEIDPRLGALMGIEYVHKSAPPRILLEKVNAVLGRKKE